MVATDVVEMRWRVSGDGGGGKSEAGIGRKGRRTAREG